MFNSSIRRFVMMTMFLGLPAASVFAGPEEAARGRGSAEDTGSAIAQPAAVTGQERRLSPADRPLRLHFSVMEVGLSAEETAQINSSPATVNWGELAKRAAQEGRAKTRCVFDVPLNRGVVSLKNGIRVPFMRSTQSTADAQSIQHQIQYEDVGCIVSLQIGRFAALVGDDFVVSETQLSASWTIELSYIADRRPVELGGGMRVPLVCRLRPEFTAIMTIGEDEYFGGSPPGSTVEATEPKDLTSVYVFAARIDEIAH